MQNTHNLSLCCKAQCHPGYALPFFPALMELKQYCLPMMFLFHVSLPLLVRKGWSVTDMEIITTDASESSLLWNWLYLLFGFSCATFPQSPTLTGHVMMACVCEQMEAAKSEACWELWLPNWDGEGWGRKSEEKQIHTKNVLQSRHFSFHASLFLSLLKSDNFKLLTH